MTMPSADELDGLRTTFDVIPFVRRFRADMLTPVAAFQALEKRGEGAFLLESVEKGENLGRYSFLGVGPRRTESIPRGESDVAARLRDELVPLRVWRSGDLPPFFGGVVAIFGYGCARWSESIPDRHGSGDDVDAILLFFDTVVAFDHVAQQIAVVHSVFSSDPRGSREVIDDASSEIERIAASLRSADLDIDELTAREAPLDSMTSEQGRDEFLASVLRAKEEIAAGEAFQIVLSQRWRTEFPEEGALALYREIRSLNPSPYMFLVRAPRVTLVGASPEMLVRVSGSRIETRPIAGTRRRGSTPDDDRRLAEELLADPKENAEHLMLVDLGRNDVGRVSSRGSVRVTRFREIERYSHVMHIVSDVEGTLRDDISPIEAFLSCFPAGTVSGAPKIRAMEIIDGLEPSRRGAYAGAVAYVGYGGSLDSCIAIRTVELRDGLAFVQAGAGIVHDSRPEAEYQETVDKSAALRVAVARARARLEEGVRA